MTILQVGERVGTNGIYLGAKHGIEPGSARTGRLRRRGLCNEQANGSRTLSSAGDSAGRSTYAMAAGVRSA